MGHMVMGGRGPWPATSAELGAALVALRGLDGLRTVEARLRQRPAASRGGTSKSALARYEDGKLPPLPVAAVLDWAYRADGWLEHAIARLWTRDWNPWRQEGSWPSYMHEHRWPADWGGVVWMDLRPERDHADLTHKIVLRWGAWRRELELALRAEGAVLMTGKAEDDDGVSRDLNLDSSFRVFTLFGAGPLPGDERVLDIRRGWVRDEPPGPEDAHGPSDPSG